jgi:hypothetical protein
MIKLIFLHNSDTQIGLLVDTEPNEKYFTFQVDEVEIVQNHLMDNSYKVSRNSTDQNRVFEWDGETN